MRIPLLFTVLATSLPFTLQAAEEGAVLTLQVTPPLTPGQVPEAMPPRFALLDDGTVYVGGTSAIETGRLEGSDVKEIFKAVDRVRKIPGLRTRVDFGPGGTSYHLVVRKGRPLDLTAVGDPASAAPALRSVASLVSWLADFDHPSLAAYRPSSYALAVREETLLGGCRRWTLPFYLAQALQTPQLVSAASAQTWPTGGDAASVCAGDKRYVVSLRPLLPGERR